MAMTAHATDYYLAGTFNGWDCCNESYQFESQGDGTFTLDYDGVFDSEFKITDGSWILCYGMSGKLIPNEVNGVSDLNNAGNIVPLVPITNPHFVFNPEQLTLVVSGEAETLEFTYSINGNIFGTNTREEGLTLKDGKWILENKTVIQGEFSVVKTLKGTTTEVCSYNSDGEGIVKNDSTMACTASSTNTFKIGDGTATFIFDPSASTLTVKGNFKEYEYIYGIYGNIFGSNKYVTEPMTLINGNWVLENKKIENGKFIIFQMGQVSGPAVDRFLSPDNGFIEKDSVLQCSTKGDYFKIGAGTATFTFNPKDLTLVVSGDFEDYQRIPKALYLRGQMNNWEPEDEWKFTTEDNKIFRLDHVAIEAGQEFKIADDMWGEYNYGGWINLDWGVTRVFYNGSNMSLLNGSDDISFVFNLEENILLISVPEYPGVSVEGAHYSVCGSIFGEDDFISEDMTKQKRGNWVLANKEVNEGIFGISFKNKYNQSFGSISWFGAYSSTLEEDDENIDENGDVKVVLDTEIIMSNWDYRYLKISAGCYTFSFDPKKSTLLVTKGKSDSSVDEIETDMETPVYFNLQGMKVNNPESGIFVKVVNGKASKVLIK